MSYRVSCRLLGLFYHQQERVVSTRRYIIRAYMCVPGLPRRSRTSPFKSFGELHQGQEHNKH